MRVTINIVKYNQRKLYLYTETRQKKKQVNKLQLILTILHYQ